MPDKHLTREVTEDGIIWTTEGERTGPKEHLQSMQMVQSLRQKVVVNSIVMRQSLQPMAKKSLKIQLKQSPKPKMSV